MKSLGVRGIASSAAAATVVFALLGCRRDPPAPEPAPTPWPGLPVSVTVKQRGEATLPGTDGALVARVGDVSRGRVPVSLEDGGGVALPTRPMRSGEVASFRFRGGDFLVRLERIDDALIGEDFVTLTFSGAPVADESARIEALLAEIAAMEGAVFLRNGEEHSASEAARHLRRKWEAADEEDVKTARAFVDRLATRSSFSGEPYRLRLADGRVVEAGPHFHERLDAIERAGG